MRRPPILVLSRALFLASCSGDSADATMTLAPATPTTIAPVEVSGTTGEPVEVAGYDVFENGTSSDDRLVGTYRLQVECDIKEDGERTIADCSGPNTMTNSGGTWKGVCEGTSEWTTTDPDHLHVFDCTYVGSGDYAGLRFIQHLEGTGYPWSYAGRIESVG
mgnify:CR=1 FL=1